MTAMTDTGSALAGFGIIGIIVAIVLYIIIIVVSLLIFWAIVRSAVRRALRDHQGWLESRGRL